MEQIHEESLATAYAAMEVQAGRGYRLRPCTEAKACERRVPPRRSSLRFGCRRKQLHQQRIETRNGL